MLELLRATLRSRGDGALAAAVGDASVWERLPERRKADAAVVGTGYLVGGQRVDPTTVEVFPFREETF